MPCYWPDTLPGDNPHAGPCNNSIHVNQCCNIGDFCLSGGMCQYGPGSSGQGASGYYIAGCTDHTFKYGLCLNNCTKYNNADVAYDFGSQAWRCCGVNSDGQRDCNNPQGPTMKAPAPAQFATTATVVGVDSYLPMTTSAVTVSGSVSPAVVTGAAVTTPANSDSTGAAESTSSAASTGNGLSPGGAAGVAIGAIAGLLIILGLLWWFVWRPRKRKQQEQVQYRPWPSVDAPDKSGFDGNNQEVVQSPDEFKRYHELKAERTAHEAELSNEERQRYELNATRSIRRAELPSGTAQLPASPPSAHEVGMHV